MGKSRIKDTDSLARDRVWGLVTFPHSKSGRGPSRDRLSQKLLAQERVAAEESRPYRSGRGFDSDGRDTDGETNR